MTEQLVPSPSVWPTDQPVKLRKLKWRGREREGGRGREKEGEREDYNFIPNCLSQSPPTSLPLPPKHKIRNKREEKEGM